MGKTLHRERPVGNIFLHATFHDIPESPDGTLIEWIWDSINDMFIFASGAPCDRDPIEDLTRLSGKLVTGLDRKRADFDVAVSGQTINKNKQ
mmetsp:Transcript_28899/g.80814  ORF Transcript_28899/g.80814 Transcript_28899/m.80814 type:complete len:92 (-) Transcript_28899:1622-1897(-)